jgi:hypothetical protein
MAQASMRIIHLEKSCEERERKQKSDLGRETDREKHLHLEREDCMVPGGLVHGLGYMNMRSRSSSSQMIFNLLS